MYNFLINIINYTQIYNPENNIQIVQIVQRVGQGFPSQVNHDQSIVAWGYMGNYYTTTITTIVQGQ